MTTQCDTGCGIHAEDMIPRGPIILLYHRIDSPPMDPQLLCVSPERFEDQLREVQAQGPILSLRKLVALMLSHKPWPENGVVITFDDGYADNLSQALPLLKKADAPATIFVATGDLDTGAEFWWDQLERIALVQPELPASLTLHTEASTFHWHNRGIDIASGDDPRQRSGVTSATALAWPSPQRDQSVSFSLSQAMRESLNDPGASSLAMAEHSSYSARNDFSSCGRNIDGDDDNLIRQRWNVLCDCDPTPRQCLYRQLFDFLRPMPPKARQNCMEQLEQWAGIPRISRATHRRLRTEEWTMLADCELIEVGAHTVNHPVLSTLSDQDQLDEMMDSKRILEEVIGQPVLSFSYPFGTRRDYSAGSVQAARQAGFSSACANAAGVVDSATKLFELPRVLVRNWDGQTLLERIDAVRRPRRRG